MATTAPKKAATSRSAKTAVDRQFVTALARGMAVLRFDRDEPPVIDVSRCMNCQVCMGMCPFGAVIWRW